MSIDRVDTRPGLHLPAEIRGTLLSKQQILNRINQGEIVIYPIDPECIRNSSVDVRLGEWYFRQQKPEPGRTHYSPYSEEDVRRVWGEPQKAELASTLYKRIGRPLDEGVFEDDYVILLGPGENILAHTHEFIGGVHQITTSMQARSTAGRNLVLVCKCAGWGDIDYINRWTMEIKNDSNDYTIPLVVARRYAQIVFHETGLPIDRDDAYSQGGKYQTSSSLEELIANWSPYDMLPKMWKDREVVKRMSSSSILQAPHQPVDEAAGRAQRHPAGGANYRCALALAMSGSYPDNTLLVVREGELVATNEDPLDVISRLGLELETRGEFTYVEVGTLRRYHLKYKL